MQDDQGHPREQVPGDRLKVHESPGPHVQMVRGIQSGDTFVRLDEEPDLWIRTRDSAETTTDILLIQESPLLVELVARPDCPGRMDPEDRSHILDEIATDLDLDPGEAPGKLLLLPEPRYPEGTPEYERFAEALRAELKLFAAGEPPYDFEPGFRPTPDGINCPCGFSSNLGDDSADNEALATHQPCCPSQAPFAPRSWAEHVPWYSMLLALVLLTVTITAAITK